MTFLSLIALLSVFAAVAYAVAVLNQTEPVARLWLLPASLCALFTAWTIATILTEGPLGFWANHVTNMWGIQVWVDLLIAVAISWTLLVPKARALGMRPAPWLLLVVTTASIGLLAMAARMLYLSEARQAPVPA